MGPNEREHRRALNAFERHAHSRATTAVRILVDLLVKATPKKTGFASRWQIGVGGPPPFLPGQPTLARYPLIGSAETEAAMRRWRPGDDVVGASPAIYMAKLAAGSSPQADAGWIPNALAQAQTIFNQTPTEVF